MILHSLAWPKTPNPAHSTFLFLHGMGGTAQLWRPIAASLEDRFNCVALDQRGHGKSQIPSSELAQARFTPLEYGTDIVETLRTLGLQNLILVGHSMGVRTGISAAFQAPELFRGLVLVDLGLSGPAGGGMGQPLRDFLEGLHSHFPTRADLRNYVIAHCPDSSIAQYLIAVSQPLPDGTQGFPFDRASLIATIDAARDTSVKAWALALAQKKMPLLFLRGALSQVWSAEQMEQEKQAFQGSSTTQWMTLDGCGHGLPFEKRIEFCKILADYENALS